MRGYWRPTIEHLAMIKSLQFSWPLFNVAKRPFFDTLSRTSGKPSMRLAGGPSHHCAIFDQFLSRPVRASIN